MWLEGKILILIFADSGYEQHTGWPKSLFESDFNFTFTFTSLRVNAPQNFCAANDRAYSMLQQNGCQIPAITVCFRPPGGIT